MSKQLFLNKKKVFHPPHLCEQKLTELVAFATMSGMHEELLGWEEERKVQAHLQCGPTCSVLGDCTLH